TGVTATKNDEGHIALSSLNDFSVDGVGLGALGLEAAGIEASTRFEMNWEPGVATADGTIQFTDGDGNAIGSSITVSNGQTPNLADIQAALAGTGISYDADNNVLISDTAFSVEVTNADDVGLATGDATE